MTIYYTPVPTQEAWDKAVVKLLSLGIEWAIFRHKKGIHSDSWNEYMAESIIVFSSAMNFGSVIRPNYVRVDYEDIENVVLLERILEGGINGKS